MNRQRVVAILSGGSEIVAAALTEELLETGFRPAIVALNKDSILRGLENVLRFKILTWPPADPNACVMELTSFLRALGATETQGIPIFATEDGGLRLLIEKRANIEPWGILGLAQRLRLGGLDKAELFHALDQAGYAKLIAPYRVASSVEEAMEQIDHVFNGDAVIKPSLKPFSMRLEGMSAKAFMSRNFADSQALRRALALAWPVSAQWIVQQRLHHPAQGETVVWTVRDRYGHVSSMVANEVWKQPRDGGTGCWVRTAEPSACLFDKTRRILGAVDFVGICEIEFLLDQDGHWRMLELNPRPWLQVGLALRAGVPMVSTAAKILYGEALTPLPPAAPCSWVNVERLLLAALSGEQGSRIGALQTAWDAWRQSKAVAIYDSTLPGVRRRWLRRLFRHAVSRTFR